MNMTELCEIVGSEILKLNNPKRFVELFNFDNRLYNLGVINRILVKIQNNDCTDVRDRILWEMCGGDVNADAKSLFILNSILDYSYHYVKDDKELEDGVLTPAEINNAIEIGMIYRSEQVVGASIDAVYDISDVHLPLGVTNVTLKEKVTRLLGIYLNITGYSLAVTSDDFLVDHIGKKIFIPKCNVEELAIRVIEEYIIFIAKIALESESISKYPKIFEESLRYSLYSNLGVKGTEKILDKVSTYSDIHNDDIQQLLSDCDAWILLTIQEINKEELKEVNIDKLRKAESLLSILESNAVYRRLKGLS